MGKQYYCEICGEKLTEKLSFKTRKYRNKRYTLICNYCGYSTILETNREKQIRNGKE